MLWAWSARTSPREHPQSRHRTTSRASGKVPGLAKSSRDMKDTSARWPQGPRRTKTNALHIASIAACHLVKKAAPDQAIWSPVATTPNSVPRCCPEATSRSRRAKDDLHQQTCAAAEDVKVASVGIAAQRLLHDYRQALHAFAHIGVAHRDPHPCARWDHRSAFSIQCKVTQRLARQMGRQCRSSPFVRSQSLKHYPSRCLRLIPHTRG